MAPRRDLLRWAAGLSLGAGLVHLLVAPEHLEEWWGYGLFFLFAAMAQIAYGVALWLEQAGRENPAEAWDKLLPAFARSGRPFWLAGMAGNLAIVGLYVVTRTLGIPFFGPEAGEVEAVSAAGIVSKALEIALIVALAALARAPGASPARAATPRNPSGNPAPRPPPGGL